MTDLMSVEEAQRQILSGFQPVSTEDAALKAAYGRVLSQDILSDRDFPLFTSSSMDGFAVRAADLAGAASGSPVTLSIIEEIPAGSMPRNTVEGGQASRIMTGAVLPQGADAVVPVEDTRPSPSGAVAVLKPVKAGDYLRPRGMDIRSGQTLIERARRLQPQDIGLLASFGIARVPVFRKPRVALLSSGDELVQPGQPLGPGKIYDSNTFTLAGLVEGSGCEVIRLGIIRDDPALVRERLQTAAHQQADLILTSAGVSVGDYDYVRAVLEQDGKLDLWRVNVRPGKPLAFGSYQGIPVMGLPGNPVSAFVTFLIFVRPVLRRLSGQPDARPNRLHAQLAAPVDSDGRESYLRGTVKQEDGRWKAAAAANQSSGNLYTLVQSNALLIVPSGVKSLPIGADIEFLLLGSEVE